MKKIKENWLPRKSFNHNASETRKNSSIIKRYWFNSARLSEGKFKDNKYSYSYINDKLDAHFFMLVLVQFRELTNRKHDPKFEHFKYQNYVP